MLAQDKHEELHPLSELPHPIVVKAAEAISHDASVDNVVGPIACSTNLRLLEIKVSQWRGGVWKDQETGVHWLVVAGLALGDHQNRDDFYKRVERQDDAGSTVDWLPTEADTKLLKQETAARLITKWELDVQEQVRDALREVHDGGAVRFDVSHPVPDQEAIATVNIEVSPVREDGYQADEIEVEFATTNRYMGSDLEWQLRVRVLIALSAPEQGWDRFGQSHTNIAEPGAWTARLSDLDDLIANAELAKSEPGTNSHYTHRDHLAGKTVEGRSARALCGVFLVPTQDHESLPVCPECEKRFGELAK